MEKVIIQENKCYMHIYFRQNSLLHEKKIHASLISVANQAYVDACVMCSLKYKLAATADYDYQTVFYYVK